jgi:hypothetical protein
MTALVNEKNNSDVKLKEHVFAAGAKKSLNGRISEVL